MAVRCVETFLSCGTCDIVAQTLIENHGWSDLDLTRSFKFAAIGFCWTGPMMTLWYPRLDRWFGSQVSFASTARKVAADQILMAPPLTLVIVVLAGLAQGKTRIQELTEKVDEEYVEVMLNRWKLWPAAQMFNFYFLSVLHRPIFTNVVALFWNTYLSWRVVQDREKVIKQEGES